MVVCVHDSVTQSVLPRFKQYLQNNIEKPVFRGNSILEMHPSRSGRVMGEAGRGRYEKKEVRVGR